jgi:hypothetical protein
VSVSDFEHDDIEPDAFGAMVHCTSLGFLYDRECTRRKTPGSSCEVIEDEDAYAQARITSSMAISYATMGFMWDSQAKTLMMFEVLPTGAWRFRRLVEADLTQPLVYVRRRYAVERVVTIKTGRSNLFRMLCSRLSSQVCLATLAMCNGITEAKCAWLHGRLQLLSDADTSGRPEH